MLDFLPTGLRFGGLFKTLSWWSTIGLLAFWASGTLVTMTVLHEPSRLGTVGQLIYYSLQGMLAIGEIIGLAICLTLPASAVVAWGVMAFSKDRALPEWWASSRTIAMGSLGCAIVGSMLGVAVALANR